MYIEPNAIFILLSIVGVVALVYFIITLNNINKLVKSANDVLNINSGNINSSLSKLPTVIDNFSEVSENMKDVTEVVTDITADVIVAKDNVKSNVDFLVEVASILKSLFIK